MTQAALARIRYGADPELFLSHPIRTPREGKNPKTGRPFADKTSWNPIPVTGLVGGTKQQPLPLTVKLPGWEGISIPNGCHIQEDGCALEFNVPPQATTMQLLSVCGMVRDAVQEWAGRKGLGIHKNPSAEFKQEFQALHPEAFIVGCDPDLDAYTNQMRSVPDQIAGSLTRHAGGHFHVGYDTTLVPQNIVVQFLDLFLGLPSLCVDKQGPRRSFYGQAGSFRAKEYGVEYRTLSNFWIPNLRYQSDYLRPLFRGVDAMMHTLMTNMDQMEALHNAIPWKDVQSAINQENDTAARQILGLGYKLNRDLFSEPLGFMDLASKYLNVQKTKEKA
jgi:hypothetical protein